jgi:D-alanine transfer protein
MVYWPKAEIECAALEMQDALNIRYLLKDVKDQPIEPISKDMANAPWNKVIKRSEERGRSQISNNLNILDTLYQKNISASKEPWTKLKLYPSKEYDDFDLMLRVLEQKGVKPLFVLIPANGRWADYAGFSAQERRDYYQRIRGMIQARGFEVADFSSKEYEPYFMQDTWHIGLKGWAEVDQVIEKFVNN